LLRHPTSKLFPYTTLFRSLIQRGKDPGRLVFDLTYFLRDMLLYKSAPSLEGLLDRARVDEHFKKVAHLLTSDWIQQAITTMNERSEEHTSELQSRFDLVCR